MTHARNYECRQLASTDVELMRAMLSMFGAAFEDPASYHSAVPSDDYLAHLLAKDHFIAIAALVGQDVVGGIAAYVLDKFEQDRREIYIYDLAVAEPHRRRGIATAMIEELREIAAKRDVYVIFVQADLEDAPAIALYDKLGSRETAHHFDFEVPRQGKS